MYKITESNGNTSAYAHFETVFYKVLAITGCKKRGYESLGLMPVFEKRRKIY